MKECVWQEVRPQWWSVYETSCKTWDTGQRKVRWTHCPFCGGTLTYRPFAALAEDFKIAQGGDR